MNTSKTLYVSLLTTLLSITMQLQAIASLPDYSSQLSKSSRSDTSSVEKHSKITLVGVLGAIPLKSFDCYGIKTLSGETYQLLGDFPKKDGALVRVRGKLLNNVRTACRVKGVVQVQSVKVFRNKY